MQGLQIFLKNKSKKINMQKELLFLRGVIYRCYKSLIYAYNGGEKRIQEKSFATVFVPKILDFVSPSIFVYASPLWSLFPHRRTENSEVTQLT